MTLSVETSQEGHHHRHLACPECGINSVVQHGSVYVCLNCGFRRNVSEPDTSVGAIAILALIFAILMMVATAPAPVQQNEVPTNAYTSNQRL